MTPDIALDGEGPLHQQIRRAIARPILAGAWPPGSRIPSEHELMARYGVSRMTVNRALGSLAEEGLVERKRKAGTVVCAGIHMSDIPAFPYALLWGERTVRSVANLTRADAAAFMALAARIPLSTHTTPFPLEQANEALAGLRNGAFDGAAVLLP